MLSFHSITTYSEVSPFMYISCLHEELLLIAMCFAKWNSCCHWSSAGSSVQWQCKICTVVCRVCVIAWRMMASDLLFRYYFYVTDKGLYSCHLIFQSVLSGSIQHWEFIFFSSNELLTESYYLQKSSSCYSWHSCNCIL